MSTATSTQARIAKTLRLLAGAEQTVDSYRKLLALAKTLPGMEYEIERLTRNLADTEDDEEDLREDLLALGYVPE